MSTAAKQTLLEWAEQHYRAQGRSEGALQARREDLRTLLEDRFGSLPESILQKIEHVEDLDRLKGCIRRVPHFQSLDELQL